MPQLEDGGRGKKSSQQMKQISEENYKIKIHIESYHPQVSHYNLAHASNRGYLPPDLSIRQLHKDYVSKNKHLSYETCRKVLEKQNIGFTAKGKNECSVCSVFKMHVHTEDEHDNMLDSTTSLPEQIKEHDCSTCRSYYIYKQRYTIARRCYTEDTLKQ